MKWRRKRKRSRRSWGHTVSDFISDVIEGIFD